MRSLADNEIVLEWGLVKCSVVDLKQNGKLLN